MTESKQKAVELVKSFHEILFETNNGPIIINEHKAVKVSIKCVEEIIKFHNTIFWQEVLTHLKEML
jgi:hypothetical protein